MRRHHLKRLGALAQVAFLVAVFRWDGWYGNLIPMPWGASITFALAITAASLRLSVILNRRL